MSKWFYPISWSLQLAGGVVLFAVAAVLEALVLHGYLGLLWLALLLAFALEALKVLVIVVHRFLVEQRTVRYPFTVRGLVHLFRLMLVALSAVCSLMFLAERLDRPHLAAVRAADLGSIEQRYADDSVGARAAHQARADAALEALDAGEQRQHAALGRRYLPTIAELEAKLDAEMDNTGAGGGFIGPRYRALQQRLADEKAAYRAALTKLEQTTASNRIALMERLEREQRATLAELQQHRDATTAAVRSSDYQGDERVEHPLARAFVNTLGAVVPRPPSTLQFVFVFALFLSLVIEFGIWVSFEHLTLARFPVFEAHQRAALYADGKAVETDAQLRGFRQERACAEEKARQARSGIEDLLRDMDFGKLSERPHRRRRSA